MAKLQLAGNGQEIDVPDAVAQDSERIKMLLSPTYPEIANARFESSQQMRDGVMTTIIKVIKQAGPKGAGVTLDRPTAGQEFLDSYQESE